MTLPSFGLAHRQALELSIFDLLKLVDFGLATGLHVSTTTEAIADISWRHAPGEGQI